MKLVNFSMGSAAPRAGLLVGNHVHDAPRPTVQELLQLDRIGEPKSVGQPLAEVKLHAPLLYPGTIYCAGANYSDHVAEMAKAQKRMTDAGQAIAKKPDVAAILAKPMTDFAKKMGEAMPK